MSCKHLAKAVTSRLQRKTYDAHIRRGDVELLRSFLRHECGLADTYTLMGDGFDIRFRHGHNGALLVEVEEK